MGIVGLLVGAIALGVAVLADFVVVLIIVRAVCRWRAVPLLAEFDLAGRPLVDRTLRRVSRLWSRLVPNRPIDGWRLLAAACVAVSIVRVVVLTLLRIAFV
ncbi:MAG: hypothetical protein IH989_05535 [Planctomycetes bacterium]|nr:hypothetical protein [Planctomycetota bacterium]